VRIVVVTGERIDSPCTRYLLGLLQREFGLVGIVKTSRHGKPSRTLRYLNTLKKEGLFKGMDQIAGVVPNTIFHKIVWRLVEQRIETLLNREDLKNVSITHGGQINSLQSVQAIRQYMPDVLFQCGAGIIKHATFNAARMGMVNLHHGIIPAIRGVMSAIWAARELQPLWLGASAHLIDEGIDTGAVLAQGRPQVNKGATLIDVLTNLQIVGGKVLIEAFRALKDNLTPVPSPKGVTSHYRSTLTFWDWVCFFANKRRFLRMLYGQKEIITVGHYLSQPKGYLLQ